jgi:UDP-glucose:glycoprotein glucosyltransferase
MALITCTLLEVSCWYTRIVNRLIPTHQSSVLPFGLFLSNAAMDDLKPVTHLLAVDITSGSGIKLLHQGLNYLVNTDLHFCWIFFLLVLCQSWVWVLDLLIQYFYFFYLHMLQIEGSKDARVGLLFSGNQTTNLFSLLFAKVFEITTSSYRFVFIIV